MGYNICSRCEKKALMCAFSDFKCNICNELNSSSHTPSNIICDKCSIKHYLCVSCGDTINSV